MHVDVVERDVARELEPHEDHAGDPQEEDVARRQQHVGRVEGAQLVGLVGPAERRERPQRAREPRVQHVRVALPARARRRIHADVGLAPAIPDRDLVAPPQLARDAPRADVVEPVEVALALALGMDADPAVLDRGDRRPGQLLHLHEPLERDQRLDPLARALRVRHLVRVGLGAVDPALFAQRGDDGVARLERGHAREALAGGGRHAPVLADHGQLLEPVLAADLEVVGVVAGRDLQRAGAELGLDVVVGDDPQPAADDRQDRGLPHEPRVAVVGRVHRDRGVAEHRLRAHGRDRDRAVPGGQRVVDVVQGVGDLTVLDLEVRDRRARPRIPVDHVVVAVDQALVVERHEDLQDRAHVRLVEREALLGVVARRAEPLVLVDDRRAVLLAPAPHALDERLATDLFPRRALARQQPLDLRLRRDPGVVGAEDPLRALAAHARVADQRVLDRAVERMAHVQRAGDVRRRDRDRVVLGRGAGGLRVEAAGFEPAREDARLALAGVIACAVLERHRARSLGRDGDRHPEASAVTRTTALATTSGTSSRLHRRPPARRGRARVAVLRRRSARATRDRRDVCDRHRAPSGRRASVGNPARWPAEDRWTTRRRSCRRRWTARRGGGRDRRPRRQLEPSAGAGRRPVRRRARCQPTGRDAERWKRTVSPSRNDRRARQRRPACVDARCRPERRRGPFGVLHSACRHAS